MVTVLKQGATKQKILTIMKKILKEQKTKGIDAKKYCGILRLKEDALKLQKGMRNEWE